jgi:hypothetical protein
MTPSQQTAFDRYVAAALAWVRTPFVPGEPEPLWLARLTVARLPLTKAEAALLVEIRRSGPFAVEGRLYHFDPVTCWLATSDAPAVRPYPHYLGGTRDAA